LIVLDIVGHVRLVILVLFGNFSWTCFSEEALDCTEYHEDYMIVYIMRVT
jgi:hypothetical protein